MKRDPTKDPKVGDISSDMFYRAVARYLEANDWKPLVIGGVAVEKPVGRFKYNFRLVVNFTGPESVAAREARRLENGKKALTNARPR